MRCVRVTFTKTGRMIYVSHLDVNRMMTRAVRRAGLPMWYTEGFNPHPYLAFALPLPLGQSSRCELMDIRIESGMTNEEIRQRLSAVMPQDVEIVSVSDPAFEISEITGAQYAVRLLFADAAAAEQFCERSEVLLRGDTLTAEKMGKKGHRKVLKQVNLIPQIYAYTIAREGAYAVLSLKVAAGNTVNLNPALLIQTLEKETGVCSERQWIERTGILQKGDCT